MLHRSHFFRTALAGDDSEGKALGVTLRGTLSPWGRTSAQGEWMSKSAQILQLNSQPWRRCFPWVITSLHSFSLRGSGMPAPGREGDGAGVSLSTSTQRFGDPTLPSLGMSELPQCCLPPLIITSIAGIAVLGWQISCLLQKNWDCAQQSSTEPFPSGVSPPVSNPAECCHICDIRVTE